MKDAIEAAVQELRAHPEKSVRQVAKERNVAKTTLHDRWTKTHLPPGEAVKRHLSITQEELLVEKINEAASKGTPLVTKDIHKLAEAICGETLGINWVSRFSQRHSDKISSRVYTQRDLARMQGPVQTLDAVSTPLRDVQPSTENIASPLTPQTLKRYQRSLRRGDIDKDEYITKLEKALEKTMSEEAMLRIQIDRTRTAGQPEKAAEGKRKRAGRNDSHSSDSEPEGSPADKLPERQASHTRARRSGSPKGKSPQLFRPHRFSA